MENSRGVPLAYAIRKTPDPSDIFLDREQDIIQNTPLQGKIVSRVHPLIFQHNDSEMPTLLLNYSVYPSSMYQHQYLLLAP